MSRLLHPWERPPAIVQPAIRPSDEQRMRQAITEAVHEAIAIVGIEGLRQTSMFPSSRRNRRTGREGDDAS
jgi:hypothetical protein